MYLFIIRLVQVARKLSSLNSTLKQTSDLLRSGASDQVTEYENRFQSLRVLHDRLLSAFIISDFNSKRAYQTAKQFFSSSTIRFAGIDGTMYSRPLFDLISFFGGAYALTGTITLTTRQQDNKTTIEYDLLISSIVKVLRYQARALNARKLVNRPLNRMI